MNSIGGKILKTRVSVRTSCDEFWANSQELNEKKMI